MGNFVTESPGKYVVLWLRLFFGAHLAYSGWRYIFTGMFLKYRVLAGPTWRQRLIFTCIRRSNMARLSLA